MSATYTFGFTDTTKATFTVKPYTINGPQTPASNTLYLNPVTSVSAVTANTSLVLTGEGVSSYGEFVQRNLLYLMENFASKTRPMYPVQGQMWYKSVDYTDSHYPSDPTTAGLYLYDGTTWKNIPFSAVVSSNLDLNKLS